MFSTCLLLGLDFIINLYFATKVFRLNKKGKVKECAEALQVLALVETMEFLAPFMFMICVIAIYFGPNAALIGV